MAPDRVPDLLAEIDEKQLTKVRDHLCRLAKAVTRSLPSCFAFQVVRRERDNGDIEYQIFADTKGNGTQIAYVQSTRHDAEFIAACLAQAPLFDKLCAAADALRQSREAQGKIREAVKALEDAEHGDERGWVDDDTVERAKAALIHTVVRWVRYGKLPAPPRGTPPDGREG